ncbi:MAG: addiction module toxin, HicA family [Betaproteobacteria bacterium]|nr:MAG: addiction module toxin, HicA family [Betaproteobacteria bacterium]
MKVRNNPAGPARRGATFDVGKGSHLRVFLNGRQSVLPMHGGEMETGAVQAVKKQLGISA